MYVQQPAPGDRPFNCLPPQTHNHQSQDYEFTNLELVKPTRMNKVYMAFAAQVRVRWFWRGGVRVVDA